MLFRVTHSVEMPGILLRRLLRYLLEGNTSYQYPVPTVVTTSVLANTLDVIRRAKVRKISLLSSSGVQQNSIKL